MIATAFKDVYDKTHPHFIKVTDVLSLIKSGKWSDKIHRIRQNTPEDVKLKKLKEYLPSICFSGKFSERFDDKIISHSGFAILDFDHIENLSEFKAEICKDPFTFSAFISPSGDGLKVLVKIPPEIENHEAYYYGLINKYPTLDTTSKNISRVCFVSYDPDLYLNEKSEVFKTKGKIVETKEQKPIIEATQTDFKKMDVLADMIRGAMDGEKHKKLCKAAYLAGGFIAGGLVEEHVAVMVLENEINKKNIIDFPAAQKTIHKAIMSGKQSPIYEETFKVRYEEVIKQDIIIEDEPAKDVIYLDDVREKILYTFEHGTSRGETTHFPDIDNHFRIKRGEITLFHGIGNHGKSAMAYQLALIKSVRDGYKWGIFSPENMPEEEFYKDLIHSYIGESTEKHHENRMSKEDLERGMDFIKDHFFLIYPKDDSPTPEYITNRFRELIIKHGIDGCIIDPYNQLDNDLQKSNGREDVYLSKMLTQSKRFAIENNVVFWIIAHPKGGLTKTKKDYDCPDVFDLSGGAMWNNKMDNILVVHRPFYSSDRENTTVTFASQKIKKQKLNGIPGEITLNFIRNSARFEQSDGFNPLAKSYASFYGNPEKRVHIEPNINFYETTKDSIYDENGLDENGLDKNGVDPNNPF